MKKNRNFFGDRNFWSTVLAVFTLILLVAVVFWVVLDKDEIKVYSHSDFVKNSRTGVFKEVLVKGGNSLEGKLSDGSKFSAKVLLSPSILNNIIASGSNVLVDEAGGNSWTLNMLLMLLMVILGVIAYFVIGFFRGVSNLHQGGSRSFGMSKSQARFFPADSVKTKFDDVAGLIEAKEDLADIIDFLKNSTVFENFGAKIPKGILMVGDPGNGKTLLAKAVAGEAGCPFLSISGSDFMEVFVGVGALRVRELFSQARKNAPCIVFIDEIDSVGKKRSSSFSGGGEERDQTLNQLLAEMDGFATEHGRVIVLAATNRADILDKALTRPGRFDRVIDIPCPDLISRKQILQLYADKVKLGRDVDIIQVARATSGCSAADLTNLINEAALNAIKQKRDVVSSVDLEHAMDKLFLGAQRRSMIRTRAELWETAVHESGHTLLTVLQRGVVEPVHKVTIIARRHSLGVTVSLPEVDAYSHSKEYFFAKIVCALGGLLAEKLLLNVQTSGVADDLRKASSIARKMVLIYGMSDLAPISYWDYTENNSLDNLSEVVKSQIDGQIQKIIADAMVLGERLLLENKQGLEDLANSLLESETLAAVDVYKILGMTVPESKNVFDNNLLNVVDPDKGVSSS